MNEVNEVNAIRELGIELKRVASLHQWVRLLEVDQKVAQLLLTFRQRDDLSPETLEALKRLQQLHLKTIEYCRREQVILESKMRHHRSNREGMAAYASVGFHEEE
ncbi:hypothetical protein [Pragia fontium]|uniref:Flagellar protein FliT n=1 Tax=Pragia fontium TaxID=82985 RepID=A0ABQ5LH86_9GAMM|nr:hypothetical protein [Pragia fontium]AKJ41402.1 hypothetical protein QQ39_04360 [Pragia fontium]GKX62961.1 hypothetical protein SOASR032_15300 [Pragia fontium]